MPDRKIRVERISREACKPFLLTIHYARRLPPISHAFGAFEGDRLVGVVTYGIPASPYLCNAIAGKENAKRVLELNRLAISPSEGGARTLLPSLSEEAFDNCQKGRLS